MANTKYTYNEKRKEWSTLVYDGTLTPTGAKHRKRISSKKSSADLEKKVAAFKREVEEGNASNASNITFGEYAEIWLNTYKATKEKGTIKMYRNVLNSSFDLINDVPLAKLTHSHVQICINAKLQYPTTCKKIALTFKQVVKCAVRDRYLPHSALWELTSDISLPTCKKPLKRALTDSEKEAMFKAELDPQERAFVSLIYYCGLRRGEVLALTPDDFDWDSKTVSVSKAWAYGEIKPYPKSNNGIRTVPLPDASISRIKPFVDSETAYLYHTDTGNLLTEPQYLKMWRGIIRKLKEIDPSIDNLTAHVFRHNYCTELCYQIPLISTKMIARLLGDDEKMVIEVYSHLLEDKEDTTTAINNIFNL